MFINSCIKLSDLIKQKKKKNLEIYILIAYEILWDKRIPIYEENKLMGGLLQLYLMDYVIMHILECSICEKKYKDKIKDLKN
jgi:hypothetical protein